MWYMCETGQWEDFVVSHVKALIPEKVKQTWRDWRKEARRKELEMTGDDDFSEGLEMASWGVEEADAANKRDASKFITQASRQILSARRTITLTQT